MNLQAVNFQRCETSGVSEIAACSQPPITADLQLYLPHLPSLLQPVSLLASSLDRQPQYASYYTVLLYFSRYHTVRLKFIFYFLCLFTYYLCEQYYKPFMVQWYIDSCVSWVPRLPLLDLQTS